MIDEKYNHLIHKEIDGTNNRFQSRKLRKYLENNHEAQQFYQDLLKLSEKLSDVPEVDPPQNLRKSILNAIHTDRYSPKSKYSAIKLSVESFLFGNKVRYAYVFATGLIIGGLGIGLILTSLNLQETVGTSKLAGTIVRDITHKNFRTVGQFDISEADLAVHIELAASFEVVLLDIRLNTKREAEIALEYDENTIRFMGYKELNGTKNGLISSGKSLQFKCTGNNDYIIIWNRISSHTPPLHFKLYSAGTLITERTIRIDPE